MDVSSRIVNVIETTEGDKIRYFTLEGVLIGGFDGGIRYVPEVIEKPKERPKGGVIKSQTPHEMQREKDREAESLQTSAGRLAHLKKDVA